MKKTLMRTLFPLMACAMLLTLASCEETFDYTLLEGEWRVEEAVSLDGGSRYNLPYLAGDLWSFRKGWFRALLVGGGMDEGCYDIYDNHIFIDFDGDGNADLRGRIVRLSNTCLSLRITDYGSTLESGYRHARLYKLTLTYRP